MGSLITDIDKVSETARFLKISLPNEQLSKTSPFATEKALQGIGGSPKSVKKLKSGDLLIETSSAIQTKSFLLAKTFLNNPVKITLHRTLNSSRGVISEPQLLHSPESEILEGLSSQGVIGVRRINIKRGASFIATKHIVLTFNTTQLPSHIKAGYLRCKVRPYIPNPIRCYNCQRFGHSKAACRGKQTCSRCASVYHIASDCTFIEPRCINCDQPHPADSKDCPQWKKEKQIQELRTKKNISYFEAKNILFPQQSTNSYTKAVKSSGFQSTQTDEKITKVVVPPLVKLKPVTVRSLRAQKASAEKPNVSSPKDQSLHKNEKSSKSEKWQQVKESKAAKRDRVLAERRNQELTLPSNRPLTEKDFRIKTKVKTDNDTDSDLVLSVHPSDEDMSTSEETYLKPHDKIQIKHYNILNKIHNDDRASGGVSLLISNDVPSAPLELNSSLQAVAVRIHLHSLITVCNLYIPPNQHVAQSELNNLIHQLPTPFVLIGDLNGHSPIWGSPNTNSRGLQTEKLITDFNLCLLNSDQETYFHQPTGTFHSTDLAICSPVIFPFFDLTIDNDLHNSDNFPLILNDNRYHTSIPWHPPKYAFAKADWTKFALLATITSDMVQNIPIDEAIQNVTKIINDAADTSIPRKNTSRKKQSKPWWNQDCQEASKRQKKAWNIFRRYPTTTNLIAFKKARAESRRIQRRSRRISWINNISSISSTISSRELWQKVKKASCASFSKGISALRVNGSIISAPKDIANTIAFTLANTSSTKNYPVSFLGYKLKAEKMKLNFDSRSYNPYNSDFTFLELQSCLSSVHKSSPGPDNISYNMIQHLSTDSQKNLLYVYNRIWNEHYFPASWQRALIIPILKPDKDPSNPSNYRPIALTSCLCKLLEKMINHRLLYFLEVNNLLHSSQSGFRKGRSTLDNLLALETDIRLSFLQRKHLVAIFFDIEKAYDHT
ncbi:hypothetical protein AVEN_14871-1, partial [Araneus ventricosus]